MKDYFLCSDSDHTELDDAFDAEVTIKKLEDEVNALAK